EVRERLALADDPAGGVLDRRAVAVVEQPLGEVGGRDEVLQALLVLDADGVAPELVTDAAGGDVHAALLDDLALGEVGGLVGAEAEGETLLEEPAVDAAGLLF